MNGPVKKPSASLTSCVLCWNWSLRRELQLQSACATHGSPTSGDLQPLHLPFLPLSPETATDHFPVWAYQMNIYFSFVSLFWISYVLVIELMLLCMFALYLLVLLLVWWHQESSGLYYFVVTLAPTAVLRSPTQLRKPVIVLLVTHPCLLHSCTKSQTSQGYVAFIGHFCPLKGLASLFFLLHFH